MTWSYARPRSASSASDPTASRRTAGKVAYKRPEGKRLDMGESSGYLDAILRNSAADPALRPVLEVLAKRALGLK